MNHLVNNVARGVAGRSPAFRRSALFLVVVLAAVTICLAVAMPAFAAREYDLQFGSFFSSPSSIAFDASGDAWVTDGGGSYKPPPAGQNGIYEFDPYPSQTLLDTPNTTLLYGSHALGLQAAVDQKTGEVFVAQSNGRTIDIFKDGAYSHSWTTINGAEHCFNCNGSIHVGIDNTDTSSGGRVYLSLTEPEDDVEVFDNAQRPVDFPATASYISGNKLTGTPSGSFGSVSYVDVAPNGDIYVADEGSNVTDEFDSSGTFVRAFPGASGVAVDPTNGNVLVGAEEYDASGNYLGRIEGPEGSYVSTTGPPAFTADARAYVPTANNTIYVFKPAQLVPSVLYGPVSSPTTTSATLNAEVGPNGGDDVTKCFFEYGEEAGNYGLGSIPCKAGSSLPYSTATSVSAKISSLTEGVTYHYRVFVEGLGGVKYGADQTYTPQPVADLTTDGTTDVTESAATLDASFVGNGENTKYYFEWGFTESYGNTTATPPGADAGSPAGPDRTNLSTSLSGLLPYTTYHYRVVASDEGGAGLSHGEDRSFTTLPGVPTPRDPAVTAVHSDRAVLQAELNANGADAHAVFEYVPDSEFQSSGWANAEITEAVGVGMGKHFRPASVAAGGLTPGTLYHLRVVGTNEAGSASASTTFRTFAFTPSLADPCPNAHVRQQTGAALLLDCRAYELVSAANAGGYDVESNLVPGQTPFGGYPEAEDPSQVLYGIHNGGIPGTGSPTNKGIDPYVATRGPNGWSTKYVGIPADNPYAAGPFASTLVDAGSGLGAFAFGGDEICSPCFADGSTGMPVRLPDGELRQGMAGSEPVADPQPAGEVKKHLSGDGSHFVFGSEQRFEPAGNDENGNVTIYDRNLNTNKTQVVSTLPDGSTIEAGDEVAELDISNDGSRILIGVLVEEEGNGKYWHLYMHVGEEAESIDLTPGATDGVLYDGMSSDGTEVYFTTKDRLTSDDTDHSADIYRADVTGSGAALTRVSIGPSASPGGVGDTDSCTPAAGWNSPGGGSNCDAVAIGGGGGVASVEGSIYFLSPELLAGPTHGVENQPNLYVDRPGSPPHFVATIDSSITKPPPPPLAPRSFLGTVGSFKRPSGIAVDTSDHVWVSDPGNGGLISEYGAYPSKAIAGTQTGEGHYGGSQIHSVAIDHATGQLLVADSGPVVLDIYENGTGHFVERFEHGFGGGHLYVAADNSGGPSDGRFYVATSQSGEGSVQSFEANVAGHEFSDTASYISGNALTGTPSGPFGELTNVTVDSTGNIYVVDAGKRVIDEFEPSGAFVREFVGTGVPHGFSSQLRGVTVDPTNGNVLILDAETGNTHSLIDEFTATGAFLQQLRGAASGTTFGNLYEGGITVNSKGYLYVADAGHGVVDVFSPLAEPPKPISDPTVIDAVAQPEARHTADFQVNPSGDDAVFPSTLPLTEYDSAFHNEIYRYNAPSETLECASCNPTSEQATGEATLATDGTSLIEDGRVFFNSTEGLVDPDLNEREDVYEWEPTGFKFELEKEKFQTCESQQGCVQLISTGTSSFNSALLSASADGTDAYFFTHDTLVTGDANGPRVKIYDAREDGGFSQVPPAHQCQASDECHGAGSPAPPPTEIKTTVGSPVGNVPQPPIHKHRHRHHKGHHKKSHKAFHKQVDHRERGGSK